MAILATLNQNSSGFLWATLKNKDGEEAVPASLSYWIACLTTGRIVRSETAISPATATPEIHLTKNDNAIIGASNRYETRRLTLRAVYDSDDELMDVYVWRVRNLHLAQTNQ